MYIDAQECMYMYTSFKGVAVDEKVGERKKKERARKTAFSCIGKLRRREVITKKKKHKQRKKRAPITSDIPHCSLTFLFCCGCLGNSRERARRI